jgi:hypothetical protein
MPGHNTPNNIISSASCHQHVFPKFCNLQNKKFTTTKSTNILYFAKQNFGGIATKM